MKHDKNGNKIEKFKTWLTARGAEVLQPTNEWEIVRFRAHGMISIIYAKKNGSTTFTGIAQTAWVEFESGASAMRFSQREPRQHRLDVIVRTLVERDGPNCFYCGAELGDDLRPTKEHLVARTAGGPDHISNIFLSCLPCNREVGHMSAPEKIRFRDQKRRGAGTTLLKRIYDHGLAFEEMDAIATFLHLPTEERKTDV